MGYIICAVSGFPEWGGIKWVPHCSLSVCADGLWQHCSIVFYVFWCPAFVVQLSEDGSILRCVCVCVWEVCPRTWGVWGCLGFSGKALGGGGLKVILGFFGQFFYFWYSLLSGGVFWGFFWSGMVGFFVHQWGAFGICWVIFGHLGFFLALIMSGPRMPLSFLRLDGGA